MALSCVDETKKEPFLCFKLVGFIDRFLNFFYIRSNNRRI